MTKTALGDEDGDFLTGSSWFERDYYYFKKSDLLIISIITPGGGLFENFS